MRRRYVVVSSFFVAILLLSLLCYGSYRHSERIAKKEAREQKQVRTEEAGDREEQKRTSDPGTAVETYGRGTGRVTGEMPGKETKKGKGFILKLRKDEIVVYKPDGVTVYEETGISKAELWPEEIKKLQKGHYVKNEKELYSILENFSS